ncbi:DegV family protein, partial [Actinotalea sp. JY-7885]
MPAAPGARGGVAVVTDSTASLPPEVLDVVDVAVVPLHVVIDGVAHRENVDLSPAGLLDALRSGARVTTSQPGAEAFARAYQRAVARGAREIVSVHLSGDLSGTVGAAGLAAGEAAVPVRVVDSRTVGMGLGLAVLAAAAAA